MEPAPAACYRLSSALVRAQFVPRFALPGLTPFSAQTHRRYTLSSLRADARTKAFDLPILRCVALYPNVFGRVG
jgi:hypothetical protein